MYGCCWPSAYSASWLKSAAIRWARWFWVSFSTAGGTRVAPWLVGEWQLRAAGDQPCSLHFLCVAAFVLIWPFYQEWRKKKRLAAAASPGGPAALERTPPSSSRSSGAAAGGPTIAPVGGPAIEYKTGSAAIQRCPSCIRAWPPHRSAKNAEQVPLATRAK